MASELSPTRFHTFIEKSIEFFTWDEIMQDAGITNASDKGDQYEITCPFHEDKRPSCRLNKTTGQYHCFSCGRKGTYTRFMWELNGKRTPYSVFCEQVLKAHPDIQKACGFNSLMISEHNLDPAFNKRRVFNANTSLGTGMSITTLQSRCARLSDDWEMMVASLTLLQQGVTPDNVYATLKKQNIEIAMPSKEVGLMDILGD